MIFEAAKNGRTKKIYPLPSFGAVGGSEIRDGLKSGSENRDKHPGSAPLQYFMWQDSSAVRQKKSRRQSVGAVVGSGIRDG